MLVPVLCSDCLCTIVFRLSVHYFVQIVCALLCSDCLCTIVFRLSALLCSDCLCTIVFRLSVHYCVQIVCALLCSDCLCTIRTDHGSESRQCIQFVFFGTHEFIWSAIFIYWTRMDECSRSVNVTSAINNLFMKRFIITIKGHRELCTNFVFVFAWGHFTSVVF